MSEAEDDARLQVDMTAALQQLLSEADMAGGILLTLDREGRMFTIVARALVKVIPCRAQAENQRAHLIACRTATRLSTAVDSP